MGTEVESKSYLPGHYLMRDLNEDSNGRSWPLYYGEKTVTNGQYYNGFLQRNLVEAYPGYDKEAMKQKMLEHEAIFKNQVYELHRLYRIQKDMMDDVKRKDLHKHWIPMETSSSSTPMASQMPPEDARKWYISSYPLANSVSGAEINHSPLSCTKVNGTVVGQVPAEIGCSSMDCEVLESRPSKVRKRLFDLQLPADEYIDDVEEQPQDSKMSSSLTNRNHKIATESSTKLFLSGGARIDSPGNGSRSGSCIRTSTVLADLNEPIQVEETAVTGSVNFLGHASFRGEVKGQDLSAQPKSRFPSLPKELLRSDQYERDNGTSNSTHFENKGNRRDWLSNTYESGHSKNNMNINPQGLQPSKLPVPYQSTHIVANKVRQYPSNLTTDTNRRDLWKEGTVYGIEAAQRSCDTSQFNRPEAVVASRIPSPYPFVNSSDFANAMSPSVTSWGKPRSTFTQKSALVQTPASLNLSASLSRNSQLHNNGSSQFPPGFGGDISKRNGFCYGSSSSEPKELPTSYPSVGFGHHNSDKDDNFASEHSYKYGYGNYLKGSKEMNLNTLLSKSSCNEAVSQRGHEILDVEKRRVDHVAVLPWLRANPACNNETPNMRRDSNSVEVSFLNDSSKQLSNRSETIEEPNRSFAQNITSSLCNNRDAGANKKILGFPIFGSLCTSKIETSLISTSGSLCPPQGSSETKNEGKCGVTDLNLASDPTDAGSSEHITSESAVVEKEIINKVPNFKNHFDLNSCITEDEVPSAPSVAIATDNVKSVAIATANVKFALEIDLEALPVPDLEEGFIPAEEEKSHGTSFQSPECSDNQPQDEVVRVAAEAIVAISSSDHLKHTDNSNSSLEDALQWFVEIVSNCADDGDTKSGNEARNEDTSYKEIDDFEAMTLNLANLKEEEYMPEPLVPQCTMVEETGAPAGSNRTRKGPGRRGRQRRDFQRDILPGLSSLSRHEVTEDLQTFGGLMKATGHSWNSGLTRRNGSGRGRRKSVTAEPDPAAAVAAASTVSIPLVQQLNNLEMGLEDRSLTGWGKTTRRPRRQRCPAGNPPPPPPSVPLT